MLEGQVAALSSGYFTAKQTVTTLEALSKSDIYREDQQTYMLYPDRKLPSFLEKNIIDAILVESCPILLTMLENNDQRIIIRDEDNSFRFNAEITNASVLIKQLDDLSEQYTLLPDPRPQLLAIYEKVFNHKAFTGRSGGMFGFEGLGCIYWHMVSKLMLVVEESFFSAIDQGADAATIQELGQHYYKIRAGIGFNKTPSEYGAFPCDPYSHTPKHAGAQQPGMTGQVKEEVLSRFGELGLRVIKGELHFQPDLLRACEFLSTANKFRYLDVHEQWQELELASGCLAFTWCQVPIIYQLNDNAPSQLTILFHDGSTQVQTNLIVPALGSHELFLRSGEIKQLTLTLTNKQLFSE